MWWAPGSNGLSRRLTQSAQLDAIRDILLDPLSRDSAFSSSLDLGRDYESNETQQRSEPPVTPAITPRFSTLASSSRRTVPVPEIPTSCWDMQAISSKAHYDVTLKAKSWHHESICYYVKITHRARWQRYDLCSDLARHET